MDKAHIIDTRVSHHIYWLHHVRRSESMERPVTCDHFQPRNSSSLFLPTRGRANADKTRETPRFERLTCGGTRTREEIIIVVVEVMWDAASAANYCFHKGKSPTQTGEDVALPSTKEKQRLTPSIRRAAAIVAHS